MPIFFFWFRIIFLLTFLLNNSLVVKDVGFFIDWFDDTQILIQVMGIELSLRFDFRRSILFISRFVSHHETIENVEVDIREKVYEWKVVDLDIDIVGSLFLQDYQSGAARAKDLLKRRKQCVEDILIGHQTVSQFNFHQFIGIRHNSEIYRVQTLICIWTLSCTA